MLHFAYLLIAAVTLRLLASAMLPIVCSGPLSHSRSDCRSDRVNPRRQKKAAPKSR